MLKAKLPAGSARAARITKSIACFICKDLRPFSVADNKGFCRMLHTLEPRYKIPSRQYCTEKVIPALYEDTRGEVEKAVTCTKRVALTCDAWTSRATESYITITFYSRVETAVCTPDAVDARVPHRRKPVIRKATVV